MRSGIVQFIYRCEPYCTKVWHARRESNSYVRHQLKKLFDPAKLYMTKIYSKKNIFETTKIIFDKIDIRHWKYIPQIYIPQKYIRQIIYSTKNIFDKIYICYFHYTRFGPKIYSTNIYFRGDRFVGGHIAVCGVSRFVDYERDQWSRV